LLVLDRSMTLPNPFGRQQHDPCPQKYSLFAIPVTDDRLQSRPVGRTQWPIGVSEHARRDHRRGAIPGTLQAAPLYFKSN
jgi:hypothetical protein